MCGCRSFMCWYLVIVILSISFAWRIDSQKKEWVSVALIRDVSILYLLISIEGRRLTDTLQGDNIGPATVMSHRWLNIYKFVIRLWTQQGKKKKISMITKSVQRKQDSRPALSNRWRRSEGWTVCYKKLDVYGRGLHALKLMAVLLREQR